VETNTILKFLAVMATDTSLVVLSADLRMLDRLVSLFHCAAVKLKAFILTNFMGALILVVVGMTGL
jgi:hypothetical protein